MSKFISSLFFMSILTAASFSFAEQSNNTDADATELALEAADQVPESVSGDINDDVDTITEDDSESDD